MRSPAARIHCGGAAPWIGIGIALVVTCISIASGDFSAADAFTLREPCTSSHDCPRGAFCRHHMSFRGQCVVMPKTPFGPISPEQTEYPPESDPIDEAPGSMPILRCSDLKPCPDGLYCATTGSSDLQTGLCVSEAATCWSTDDCSPSDYCDKKNEDLDLSGYCRQRESDSGAIGSP